MRTLLPGLLPRSPRADFEVGECSLNSGDSDSGGEAEAEVIGVSTGGWDPRPAPPAVASSALMLF